METIYNLDMVNAQLLDLRKQINAKEALVQTVTEKAAFNQREIQGKINTLRTIVEELLEHVAGGTHRNGSEIEQSIDEIIDLFGLEISKFVSVSVEVTHTVQVKVGRNQDVADVIRDIDFSSGDGKIESDSYEIDENSIEEL